MKGEKGLILIITMWVITILMVITMSFSLMVRTETHSTIAFREELEKKYLAEAGIERGIVELFYRNQYGGQKITEEEKKVWRVDGSLYTIPLSKGQVKISLMDESGKININNLNDQSAIILKNLLVNFGLRDEEASVIIDSILDWKDGDDLRRLNGAESDYYMSLPTPYKAKNANFDTLEELLLVKGMNQEILFGNDGKKGIIEYITLYSGTSGINLRTAPKEVLLAIPGLTSEIVDEIISKRMDLTTSETLTINLPQESAKFISQMAVTSTYTVKSTAFKDNERSSYTIVATVLIEGGNRYRYLYYKSPARL
ncbi:MAG: general secretion pathway protein GspK [Thermodesulfovibrionales bacterium]|nr:general secretion pathway protein GspK [Thermodesulfovibrionales bacterium]